MPKSWHEEHQTTPRDTPPTDVNQRLDALEKQLHVILVMLDRAGIRPPEEAAK